MNKTISLNGQWSFRRCTEEQQYPATVPGTVCADLLACGLMEDPFYRDNENKTLELLRHDFEYTRTFSVQAEDLCSRKAELVFHGLDTIADVWLNDRKILHADDMHRTWRVDVKELLREGENSIRVRFFSAAVWAERLHAEHHVYQTRDTMHGFEQVRKAHCMYGWDWGPKIPDMGIFRPIELHLWDKALLSDCYVRQSHSDGRVTLRVQASLDVAETDTRTLYMQLISPHWRGAAQQAGTDVRQQCRAGTGGGASAALVAQWIRPTASVYTARGTGG